MISNSEVAGRNFNYNHGYGEYDFDYIQPEQNTIPSTIEETSESNEGTIEETLQERGDNYGPFHGHAQITQDMKNVMQNTNNWETLSNDKKEALEMIVHKIGRILNGDPEYKDSWHDIIGYAKLVDDTL